ncbi:MAG: Crp/Fnr family transcriptional regulator [Bacteroidota bacterium]
MPDHPGKLCRNCKDCESKATLFKLLSEDELEQLNENRYSVRYKPGEIIVKQGTKANFLLSMVGGFGKMYIEGHNNRNLILGFVRPGEIVTGPCIHAEEKYKFTVMALEESHVCFIDVVHFRRAFRGNGFFAESYLEMLSRNFARNFDRMVSLTQKQMHGRIADVLIYLSREIYNSPVFETVISRQDIADYSGMSKDSAIRILKEFERDRIINLKNRSMEICNMDRLYEISATG